MIVVAYQELQNLTLFSNLTSRDIDVIQYNEAQAKIALYCTLLNQNIKALREELLNYEGVTHIPVSETDPTGGEEYYFRIVNI